MPLRLKPTDWESVFRSAKEEFFCRPESVRSLLERRTRKPHRTSRRLRLMACGFGAQFLGLEAEADNAPLPRLASRRFSSLRHDKSCTLLIVISALSNKSILTAPLESGWTQASKSKSTSAITRTLTMATQ